MLIVIVENKENPLEAPIYEIRQFMSENIDMFTTFEIEYEHGIKAYIYEKSNRQRIVLKAMLKLKRSRV